jgi:eukaryotic-like serine/threonine-protein kinase
MPLTLGTKFGPYEIVAPIGAGGMGEVYRATDTRLDRTVAIKVISGDVTVSQEAKQRFDREARALSSFSHPHICALYDIGHDNGSDFLVMEFLEGETLARRLERGALPIRELLKIGVEIADALDKAHRQGMVHRDLKPGNIMLTKSGAKLLDFGLVKPAGPSPAMVAGLADAATRTQPTSPITQQGFLVGTFQYMSPEQVQGQEADSRSDIFAFGAVLYEMATGKRAFQGKSQISVASAILEKDPEPISSIQSLTPPALEHVVERALAKEPEDRWQSASDIKAELKWISASGSQTGINAHPTRHRILPKLAWLVAAVLAGAVLVLTIALWNRPASQTPVVRSSILPPDGAVLISTSIFAGPVEVSPDGTRVVFSARKGEEAQLLWVRSLSTGETRQLPGTEGADRPFWSWDGRSIGFFADRKLKKIDAAGGSVFTLADAPEGRGGTWNSEGVILFSPGAATPILRVPANGGSAVPVTKLDVAQNEITHRYPEFLPDGQHFLFLTRHSQAGAGSQPSIFVGSLDGAPPKKLFEAACNVKFSEGHLIYVREQALVAQRFDVKRLQLEGDPVTLANDARMDQRFSRGVFSASQNGVLAFETGIGHTNTLLQMMDRKGMVVDSMLARSGPAEYFNGGDPKISPDGKKVLAAIVDLRSGTSNIWQIDLVSGARTQLTSGGGDIYTAVWSPDGQSIAYGTTKQADFTASVMTQPFSGSTPAEVITHVQGSPYVVVDSWSPDGRTLLYGPLDPGYFESIWAIPVQGERKPALLLPNKSFLSHSQFSPDGRFVAYVSSESGRDEVYVTPFPNAERRWQVSQNGGTEPRWRRDGAELFYFGADNRLQAAQVKILGGDFAVGQTQSLFTLGRRGNDTWRYDVMPDGQHFVVNTATPEIQQQPITLITNWTGLLQKN